MEKFNISFYSNISDKNPIAANLKRMVQGFDFKDEVYSYREKSKKVNSTELATLKRNLPQYTVSGLFESNKDESLIKHSGFICLDIDKKDNPMIDMEKLKWKIADAYCTYSVSYSIGGEGLMAIWKIEHPELHRQHFKAISKLFSDRLGVRLDQNCINVSRKRTVTFDSCLYLNENCESFKEVFQEPKKVRPKKYNYPKGFSISERDRVLNLIKGKISNAMDGQKHIVLLKMSNLAGGYVASGVLDEEEVRDYLFDCICQRNIDSEQTAWNTICQGIENGTKNPIK